MVTSYTKTKFEIHQHLQEEEMSIQELVAEHLNKEKNRVQMSFEGQHESLPNILEVNIEEENMNYNKNITLRSNEELVKPLRVENEANKLKALVVMEDEPTSPKSHEKTNDEVVKTIPEMDPWGEMLEELKK